jgi:hypothetical protein
VKLSRSSEDGTLKGRRGVISLFKLLSVWERLERCRGLLPVPGVAAAKSRSCLLGLQPSSPVLVGDSAEFCRAAKRVRSASGIAEKVLMSFTVSSMVRVMSVSSPVSCPILPDFSCMIVLIPSSGEARCNMVSFSSDSSSLGDSNSGVDLPSERTAGSARGDAATPLLSVIAWFFCGDVNLLGLGAPLLDILIGLRLQGEHDGLESVSWTSSSSDIS